MTQKASSVYIVELDGSKYRWTTGGMRPTKATDHQSGDRWLVTDMQRSVARFMTVEAPLKYADVVIDTDVSLGVLEATVKDLWERKFA